MMIAEVGVNHNGDVGTAKKLIDAACEAGADAVKFQIFKTEYLAVLDAKKAQYQVHNTGNEKSQFEMLKELELSEEDFRELFSYCSIKNMKFLASPFDEKSADFLGGLGVEIIKIPSGEITNYMYLKKIASLNKQIIMSTGMATIQEIAEALAILNENKQKVILLHCTSSYPTPMQEVNLNAMQTLKRTFHKEVGYSDHTPGIEVSIAAATLGACVIEKHITLDKNSPGPDHSASLEPDEFKKMVQAVRNIEQALGNGRKRPTDKELKNREYVRKSLVASRIIKKGEIFAADNLCAKRAGYGVSPMKMKELLGTKAKRDYETDERIDEW
jgi:N,N'-diacetyllegionaminate synthase